jgi:opine dehydrogenase
MEIAVVGAGNGGQATAAHLSLEGHRVRLYDRFLEVTAPFAATRRLTVKGAIVGKVEIAEVTNEIERAVLGAEVVLVTVPGFAVRWIAAAMAPHLDEGQIVVLHPGGTFGALEARTVFSNVGARAADIVLAETETLVYACRASTPGKPDVKAVKREVKIAAFPMEGLPKAHAAFSSLYPQASPATSVLETGLANMNAVIHPAIALLNAGAIERRQPGFDFYAQGITEGVAALLATVDAERMAIAEAFGVPHSTYEAWIERHYGVSTSTPVSLFQRLAAEVYQGIGTPESLQSRYISEDVPMALVPMEALASLAGIATPAMSAIISLFSIVNGADYRTEGRTLEQIGLAGMTPAAIMTLVAGTSAGAHL